jgi:hypothetical protein
MGSHRMGDGRIFFYIKTSAPLSLMTTYRMSLISTGAVSLDSTFKTLRFFIQQLMGETDGIDRVVVAAIGVQCVPHPFTAGGPVQTYNDDLCYSLFL